MLNINIMTRLLLVSLITMGMLCGAVQARSQTVNLIIGNVTGEDCEGGLLTFGSHSYNLTNGGITNTINVPLNQSIPVSFSAFGNDACNVYVSFRFTGLSSCWQLKYNETNNINIYNDGSSDSLWLGPVSLSPLCYGPTFTNITIKLSSSSEPEILMDASNDQGIYQAIADGKTMVRSHLYPANWENITWSIVSDDDLGCTIDTNGIIKVGVRTGVLKVRAMNNSNCYVEKDLELISCEEDCSKTGDITAALNSVDLSISLGRGAYGRHQGYLTLYSPTINNSLYSPAALRYNYGRSVQVVWTTEGVMRQLLTDETLVDICPTNSGFRLNFYPRVAIVATNREENGVVYVPLTNRLFRTIKIGNPDASGNSRLAIADVNPFTGFTNSYYVYAKTNGVWYLTCGMGERTETKTSAWSETNTLETIIREVRDANNQVVQVTQQKWRVNSLGRFLVEESWGSGTNRLSNQYTYTAAGDIELVTRHDGYWEQRQYDAQRRLTRRIVPYQNATPPQSPQEYTSCRIFEYEYSNDWDYGVYLPSSPRVVKEKLFGTNEVHEIRRRYTVLRPGERHDIVCSKPLANISDTNNNLRTTTLYYTNGVFKDEIKSIFYQDGTVALFTYTQEGANRINVKKVGKPNSYNNDVVDGVLITNVIGVSGQPILKTETDIATGRLLDRVIYTDHDDYGRPQRIVYLDGTSETFTYTCCGVESMINRDGVAVQYGYTPLKQPLSESVNGITIFSQWDPAGHLLMKTRRGTNNTDLTLFTAVYDNAGKMRTNWNALGQPTIIQEGGIPWQRTTFFADGGLQQETYYRDGTLASRSGSAVFPVRYDGGTTNDGGVTREYRREIKLGTNGQDTLETTTYLHDGLGRVYKTLYASSSGTRYSQSFYNGNGQLERTVDPDGVTTLYRYNGRGELETTAVKRVPGDTIDWSQDEIMSTVRSVVTNSNGHVFYKYDTFAWLTIGSTSSNRVAQRLVRVDGLETRYRIFDTSAIRSLTNLVVYQPTTQTRYEITLSSDGSATTNTYQQGRLASSFRYAGTNCIGGELYAYDPHGRLWTVTDARTGTVKTNLYNNGDLLSQETWSANGLPLQTTSFAYDARGRLTLTTLPDGLSTTTIYSEAGLLRTNKGARTYQTHYNYDAQGRLKSMTTWTNTSVGNSATTTWNYDNYAGWLNNKNYQGATGPTYGYTPAGRLKTRIWARGTITTYSTNVTGRVSAIDYSDATPDVALTYDRAGRLQAVATNGVTAVQRTHTMTGLLESESQGDVTVGYEYNDQMQLVTMTVKRTGTNLLLVGYQYDAASRLRGVSFGIFGVTISYWPTSSLVSSVEWKCGTNTSMTQTRSYDGLQRLVALVNAPTGQVASVFLYGHNLANQRVAVTNTGGMRWEYQYDFMGQLTNAVRKWSDGTPVAGQQFGYVFDEIGNRRLTVRDGRVGTSAVNLLNQVTGQTNPGFVNLLGMAAANATVTVNLQRAERRGEYFRKELWVDNTGGPVWLALTNIAVLNRPTNDLIRTNFGRLYVPPLNENLQYDADGNLTSDGQWAYAWDAENRLIAQETLPAAYNVCVPRQKLVYGYDWQGRRVSKVVSNWVNGAWVLGYAHRFIYDGWNLVAILDAVYSTRLMTFVWGHDLSGTPQGAGGVGGLLATIIHNGTNAGVYFPMYDGNGNVMGYVRGADGVLVSQYEYGPFGELLRATGPLAPAFPHLFSTKYHDWETSLYSYSHRYYHPSTGRWLSRDPIGEMGGINLYTYVGNNPIMFIDPYGLSFWGDFGNGLNNTVSGIGQLMGQGLYDLTHLTWSQSEYSRIANMMYSMDTPENPAATPYVMGALGVSAAAATTAAVALGGEVAASRGCFKLSEHVLRDSIGQEGRYWSEIAARNAIRNGPRMANVGGETPIWNTLTTFKYPIGNGGQIVLNPWTRTIVQYLPKW